MLFLFRQGFGFHDFSLFTQYFFLSLLTVNVAGIKCKLMFVDGAAKAARVPSLTTRVGAAASRGARIAWRARDWPCFWLARGNFVMNYLYYQSERNIYYFLP